MPKLFLPKTSKIHGKKRYFSIFLLIFALLVFSTCDTPMGMGEIVDLEAPILYVTSIELQDGTVRQIMDENGKIFIGPGILFGKGATLKGKAWDNIDVAQIQVTESATNSVWTSSNITNRSADAEGWQNWSISLEGLQNGERNIEITAYDNASLASSQKNIGPDTTKQLTLLVDTEPPIVETIKVERHPGIIADLLPRTVFDTLDIDNFDNIDYFQNEKFTIRASITHEFNLEKVTLNFLDENGKRIFDTPREASGPLYTPYWDITASDLIAVNPAYSTGRHYLKAIITATAAAGHSGSNVITNQLFNLCWYPESDYPHIVIEKSDNNDTDNMIHRPKNSVFPLNVFDDDQIDEAYYAIVTDTAWNDYRTGETDEQKMAYLRDHKSDFPDLATNQIKTTGRNAVIAVKLGQNIGEYRLIVLAKENKTSSSIMTHKLYTLKVSGEDDPRCSLVSIVCENPDGAYPKDSVLKFKLIFSAEMYTVGDVWLKIQGGNTSVGDPVTINFPVVPDTSSDFALIGTWTVPEGIVFDPVVITDIDVSNARRWLVETVPTVGDSIKPNYNTSRTGLKVMSIKPEITHLNLIPVENNNSVLNSYDGKWQLKLSFNHAVFPENGTITIKPASGWLIPPVLTNEDFAKINNAVSSTDQTALINSNNQSYYIETTHGLIKNTANQYTGVPDTDTKYVLNFSSGLDNASLRGILDKAKYNWQEIDVSGSQILGAGTDTIIVDLDKLPDGRQWKVEIVGPKTNGGAFRDEAGNTFDGWGTSSNFTFWSEKTAEPVIRVNRVSNNSATVAPSSNRVEGTPGTASEITSRINVQYRIDCETPGAVITYGTQNISINTVSSATTGFGANSASDSSNTTNSNNADATIAQLGSISINQSYNLTGTNYLTIGDTNLYTARKDYIAATATRNGTPSLATSNRGYEGAFKTVIVYRKPPDGGGTLGTNRFVKLEATNTQNGAVTISGFPMNYNDMSGKSSKNAYRNPAATDDWIWISWEIVSNFWHVGMIVDSSTPNSPLPDDPWRPFENDWYAHNFRKYGNWGLRIGN